MTIPNMGPTNRTLLHGFLSAWLSWVESGAAEYEPFAKDRGLCDNVHLFVKDPTAQDRLSDALCQTLEANTGECLFPFGEEAFEFCRDNCCMHEDENRLYFVRERLKELDDAKHS